MNPYSALGRVINDIVAVATPQLYVALGLLAALYVVAHLLPKSRRQDVLALGTCVSVLTTLYIIVLLDAA